MAVLTDSADPNNYWKVLKNRLKKEGSELVTNCNRLKLRSPKDGKTYNTDVLDTKGVLRLVQSIPSPKAEPFKCGWLRLEASGLTNSRSRKGYTSRCGLLSCERLYGRLDKSAFANDRNAQKTHGRMERAWSSRR